MIFSLTDLRYRPQPASTFCLSQTEIPSSRLHWADTIIGMNMTLALELGIMYDFGQDTPVHLQP